MDKHFIIAFSICVSVIFVVMVIGLIGFMRLGEGNDELKAIVAVGIGIGSVGAGVISAVVYIEKYG